MEIKTFMLTDGSQLVAKVLSSDEEGVLLEDVKKLLPVLDDKNQWQIALQDYPLQAKEPTFIENRFIMIASEPTEVMERYYIQQTTTLDLNTKIK